MAQTYNLDGLKDGKPLAREEGGRGVQATALYRHPNGQEAIVQYDPLFGNAQANAFERLGYVFVREARPEEVKTIPELVTAEMQKDGGAGNLAALTASIVEQNKLLAGELNKQREERNAVPQDATDISGELARQSAADQANVRTQAHGEVAVTDSGDMVKVDGLTPKQVDKVVHDDPNAGQAKEAPEHVGFGAPKDESSDESATDEGSDEDESVKPLDKQNRTELNQTALAEGVENPDQYETKKDLVDAIVAKQAEGVADPATDEGSDEDESEQE